ncbi:glycosyltransferase family 2 protein [Deinococcus sp. Arct2-2]|uniref:glycosyltransferase family 2 protein n=1 Tax=Deinococcus sp. Arct2-2 TaxID=2568653 RepID=UPI0010A3A7D2|nr:glycosyltransferase [Deinococcus sp. Arct2-2]THF69861.1 glycosyltransferase family 2 protein [Deinococcus sp. Arct2-2]
MIDIQVLLTVFNRREKTLEALHHLYKNQNPNVRLLVTLFDDGSQDGTAAAIAAQFPEVQVLTGDGSNYWNGGMRRAWEVAKRSQPEFYLWLNDDTLLDSSAIRNLLDTSAFFADQAIIVGSTRDPETGALTYGGVVRKSRWKPVRFHIVSPGSTPIRADTMNGNCVLVPRGVEQKLGILSPAYTHSMGDFDYGLRAKKLNIEMWIAPEFVGTCGRNQIFGTWQDTALTKKARWFKLIGVKGLPPKEWAAFTYRHGGVLWPITWLSPYIKCLLAPTASRAQTDSGN